MDYTYLTDKEVKSAIETLESELSRRRRQRQDEEQLNKPWPSIAGITSGVPGVAGAAEAGQSRHSNFEMDSPREHHLVDLMKEIASRVDSKYRAGQREHGGDLWKKTGILEMAIDEAVDQLVYLLTLKGQIDGRKY